ncbi:MAG: single-strand DNA-binding protein [Oceanicoccus sp.]|jgi:single-strand DNA-binding protein
MRSVNKVVLIGNLTRLPELKATASGQSIVTFGLATNRQWTTSGGEKRTSAEFHECVAWAKLAEICNSYLKKGMLVYVEGYLKTRSWDMDDGTRRFRTEIVLQDMIILEKRAGEHDDFEAPEAPASIAEPMSQAKVAPKATPAPTPVEAPKVEAPAPSPTPTPEVEVKAKVEAPAPSPAPATPVVEETAAPGELSADLDNDNMF